MPRYPWRNVHSHLVVADFLVIYQRFLMNLVLFQNHQALATKHIKRLTPRAQSRMTSSKTVEIIQFKPCDRYWVVKN